MKNKNEKRRSYEFITTLDFICFRIFSVGLYNYSTLNKIRTHCFERI